MSTLTDVIPDQLAQARFAGQRQAEAFEHALAERERQEREDRLARIAWGGEDTNDPLFRRKRYEQVEHLERQVEILASFHNALLRSRGWRLLQAMRRLIGRAW